MTEGRPHLTSVTFGRSGGIAGITMGATVPAEDLDSEQLDILSGLLRSGDSTEEGPVPGGPDRFSYHLQVRVGHRTHQFDWPEGAVPPQVQPLLAELNRRATPQ